MCLSVSPCRLLASCVLCELCLRPGSRRRAFSWHFLVSLGALRPLFVLPPSLLASLRLRASVASNAATLQRFSWLAPASSSSAPSSRLRAFSTSRPSSRASSAARARRPPSCGAPSTSPTLQRFHPFIATPSARLFTLLLLRRRSCASSASRARSPRLVAAFAALSFSFSCVFSLAVRNAPCAVCCLLTVLSFSCC
ncbi:hypothetical protein AB1Y20_002058 [Prymnesium parvum]|uniref:Transmembrane protein n=1 Tax=Prymnesium parvum TaxID=97485 RepID=A0AB34JAL5_PRYPA